MITAIIVLTGKGTNPTNLQTTKDCKDFGWRQGKSQLKDMIVLQ